MYFCVKSRCACTIHGNYFIKLSFRLVLLTYDISWVIRFLILWVKSSFGWLLIWKLNFYHTIALWFNHCLPSQNGIWAKFYHFGPKNDGWKQNLRENKQRFFVFNWLRPKKCFFRNKTFLLFKIGSWNFQHLFKNKFRETSQNFNSIRRPREKM